MIGSVVAMVVGEINALSTTDIGLVDETSHVFQLLVIAEVDETTCGYAKNIEGVI